MFVDTSAIVAMLAKEPDAADLALRLARAKRPITSGLVILEASMVLSGILGVEPADAEAAIRALLDQTRIALVPIDGEIAGHAVAAFAAYGKGRHRARLNLADCMSYACAKAHAAPLLFKGNDFGETDIALA
jgi:ribonuclease VapC